MRDTLYLAWRYLVFNRLKTAILVLSIGLISFLPIGLEVLVSQSSKSLVARAESTPLVIGAKGSPLELVLNTLYLESDAPQEIPFSQAQRVIDSGLATAIPIYNRFHADTFPIVGTGIDYFSFRGLKLAQGRKMGLLGECVIGAKVAEVLGVSVGDAIVSSPESVFDLAGIYPLKMKVVGILEVASAPDDSAIFTDIKTTWIISGLAHGHQDLTKPEAADVILGVEEGKIIANASVIHYNEITDQNRDSFHFHGDPNSFPITAIIAVPNDTKSGTILQGKYLGGDERMQIVQPTKVVGDLLGTILTIHNYVLAGAAIAGGSMIMTAILVLILSLRLRQREIETMYRIGVLRHRVVILLGTEIAVVLLLGLALAAFLTLILASYGEKIVQSLLF